MTDETVAANGLEFACLRRGDGDRLALCLHGFPDDAGSMEPLLGRLADEGYTAVAPYMRGYAPTDPAPDGDYSAAALGTDAIEVTGRLLERDGLEDAVLVGHDWGAVAGYAAARFDPDRFSKLVAMAVPPALDAMFADHPRQLLRSWYMWVFQLPVLPERWLRRDDFALIEVLWHLWSPGWDYPEERIESVKETFRAEGTVEAALAYYRQTVDPPVELLLNRLTLRGDTGDDGRDGDGDVPSIGVPGLVMAGADDGCIGPELFEGADRAFDARCRVVRVRDAGHFLHQEQPGVVGDEIAAFLAE